MKALDQLRALARYQTHGGYRWAAVMIDGELICEKCAALPNNYRLMYRATKTRDGSGWECVGITHSGESEEPEYCAHCYRVIWESVT
jgi:hypothetical protein